jgi:rare lipoprotein A
MKKVLLFTWCILFFVSVLANNKLPQTGLASYYSDRLNHHRMSCGIRYCKDSFVAAHRTLPFGTYLKVTNLKNCRIVIVRVSDRGPRARKRIIDLSGAAATMLGFRRAGIAKVTIELALPEEVLAFHNKMVDSMKVIPVAGVTEPEITAKHNSIRIQGGSFKIKASALSLKKYLNKHHVKHVTVKAVKVKGREVYKVIISTVNDKDKVRVLRVLENKHIKGFVIGS